MGLSGEYIDMIALLSKLFIKNREDGDDPTVRQAYGILCGSVGIALNFLLFLAKALAGLICGSISVTADALNNLSDAGSSCITLIGFLVSGRKPDRDHPFGHGRVEYLAGLAMAGVILVMAAELIRTSFLRILHPGSLSFHPLTAGILLASILVKLYMFTYNRGVARHIGSAAMKTAAIDSLGDVLATFAVLAATLIEHFTGLHADGWCGLLVGLFIAYAGFDAARTTINPLLGQKPDPAFVKQVEEIVLSDPSITGMHDLLVHNYGPGHTMISLHAEVPASGELLQVHNAIDSIERILQQTLHCEAVIHMDPVVTDDAETLRVKRLITEAAQKIDPTLRLHDFRLVKKADKTWLLFDVLAPYRFEMEDSQIVNRLNDDIRQADPSYQTMIHVDRG